MRFIAITLFSTLITLSFQQPPPCAPQSCYCYVQPNQFCQVVTFNATTWDSLNQPWGKTCGSEYFGYYEVDFPKIFANVTDCDVCGSPCALPPPNDYNETKPTQTLISMQREINFNYEKQQKIQQQQQLLQKRQHHHHVQFQLSPDCSVLQVNNYEMKPCKPHDPNCNGNCGANSH